MAEKIELQNRLREIPYNYTSFADKDIVTRLLGKEAWTFACRVSRDDPPECFMKYWAMFG